MLKPVRVLIALAACGLTIASAAGRVRYAVDPATVSPQPATVAIKGQGMVLVAYTVPEFQPGQQFTFRLDLTSPSSGDAVYPSSTEMRTRGRSDFDAEFSPAEVTFSGPNETVSCFVTLTVPSGGHARGRKMTAKIKTSFPDSSNIGNGPGVKVMVLKAAAELGPVGAAEAALGELIEELDAQPASPARREE